MEELIESNIQSWQTMHRELNYAYCARPFDVLGMHPSLLGGWQVTVWMPGASGISLVGWDNEYVIAEFLHLGREDSQNDNRYKSHEIDDLAGLFICHLPDWQSHQSYRLLVTYDRGDQSPYQVIKDDPYMFGQQTYEDFQHDGNHLYKNHGAHLKSFSTDGTHVEGVRFVVYAPNARSVSVVGDFNHWDGRVHPMGSSHDGHWRLFIPGVQVGQGYKFEIKTQHGEVLPHKTDPYSFSIDQYPSFASRVYDHRAYQWQDEGWQKREPKNALHEAMSIYEVHLGSWCFDQGRPLCYRALADKLVKYVKDMGFTHVELMPISEYPFDGSWGYQPIGLFSPTTRFGQPDDFKYFVDQCHQAGIGVILDWVPAHFPEDGHGLARFDGSTLYEYEDPKRGWHKDWNSLIYDYGRRTVCEFLISNAVYWFDEFHIDGIRVDAVASMLYLDYAREEGEWIPNVDGGNVNYEAKHFLQRLNETIYQLYPKAMTMAEESTSFTGVSKPTYLDGLGFGFKWNMGWMNDSLEYIEKDPMYRSYHHGELTFSMIYAFHENFILPLSHDEVVHGKRSLLDKMPGDCWQKFANLRAFLGYMFAHPGKKLNFMGNEFAQGQEWNHSQSLDWHLLEVDYHKAHQGLFRDLNHLYRSQPSLYQLDFDGRGFCWITADDYQNSVLAFVRYAQDTQDFTITVVNFTPVPRPHYRIGVPSQGQYELIMNTDAACYCGSDYAEQHWSAHDKQLITDQIESHGEEHSLALNLPPLAMLMIKPHNTSEES